MKISKTLKRLRNEKNITQDELAQQLYISRQSVSSWENDRTQPSIDMLIKLSEIFDVSIEELIYGQKRNTSLETEKPNYNGTLLIIFSILGTLLLGTGIVLIFVYYWQKMPVFFKAMLSLLPLLAGQASGLFVLTKKRDKLPWCEGASVLWTAGIAVTLAMIYNIFDLDIFRHTILIIVSVCIIPVIFLLNAAAPIAVYYICTITWCFFSVSGDGESTHLFITLIMIIPACIFTARMLKKENKSLRSLYSHWISILSIISFVILSGIALGNNSFSTSVTAVGASGLALLLISSKEPDIMMPYKIPGLFLTCAMLILNGIEFDPSDITVQNIVFIATCSICVLAAFFAVRKKLKDGFFISFITVSFLSMILASSCQFFFPAQHAEILLIILMVTAFTANILLMISGGKEKKLLPVNLGFISVAAVTMLFLSVSGLSLIGNGLLCLAFGAVLLAINFIFSKQNKKMAVQVNDGEVRENEEIG